MGTTAKLTTHAGVANAIGAITGSIGRGNRPGETSLRQYGITSYGCHGSSVYFETEDYDEALEWAENTAAKYARDRAEAMGASNITVEINQSKNIYQDGEIELLMETVIIAKAIGNQAIVSTTV